MTFYEWITRLRGRGTPIGNLLRVMDEIEGSDKVNNTCRDYIDFFVNEGVNEEMIRIFIKAWNNYRMYQVRHDDDEKIDGE